MKDPHFYKLVTGLDLPKLRIPKHETNAFVDDAFNTIAFHPSDN